MKIAFDILNNYRMCISTCSDFCNVLLFSNFIF